MLWIIVSILVVAIDQISKYFIVKNITPDQMIPVIDKFFYLTLHKNPGAAWGIMQNSRMFFLIIIPIISVAVIYFMAKNNNRFLRFSLALILGGAAGNYIDRLFEGKVTDFLLFYIGSYPFPIFNAADMAVTCGTALLAIYMLFIYKEPPKEKKGKVIDKAEVDGQVGAKDQGETIDQSEVSDQNEVSDQSEVSDQNEMKGKNVAKDQGEVKDAE